MRNYILTIRERQEIKAYMEGGIKKTPLTNLIFIRARESMKILFQDIDTLEAFMDKYEGIKR